MESRTKRKKSASIKDKNDPTTWLPADELTPGLIDAFQALSDAGFRSATHESLYQDLIENSLHAYHLALCIRELRQCGFSGYKDKDLYEALMKKAPHAYQLVEAIRDLKGMAFNWSKIKDIFFMLFNRAQFAFVMASAFRALTTANISEDCRKDLYLLVIEGADKNAHNFAWAAETLNYIGLTGWEFRSAYEKIVIKGLPLHILSPALHRLKDAGFHVVLDCEVFDAAIDHADISDKLSQAFVELKKAGYSWDKDADLYTHVLAECAASPKQAYLIVAALQRINSMGHESFDVIDKSFLWIVIQKPATLDELLNDPNRNEYVSFLANNYVYITQANSINPGLAKHVFDELKQAGVSALEYSFVYATILNQIGTGKSVVALKLLNKVCSTLKQYPEKLNKWELELLVEDVLAPKIHYGPLIKTDATHAFECLLSRIAQVNKPEDITMTFDQKHGYTIALPNEPPVNVTLLLQYANLSHLTLSDELIDRLDQIIRMISPYGYTVSPIKDGGDKESALTALTTSSQRAIYYYTTQRYKNINRIFRGEQLSDGMSYGWINPLYSSNSYLANFLCGCIVNAATTKLEPLKNRQSIYDPHAEACSMPVAADPELSRGEKVSAELKKRRLANVMRTPSVTSFSHFKGGSDYFHNAGTTHTKLKGDYHHYPVINPSEGEIIFSHGEQIEYHNCPDGGFFATLIRSPDHQKPEGYIAGLALQHAFEQHFQKPYKEGSNRTTVNGVDIERPNHGLAHTYRVMMNVTHVINYFAAHAIDDDFKDFCTNICGLEHQLLCAAAAFSITGRESEIAAVEDLVRYDSYRNASAQHFQNFLDNHIPQALKPAHDAKERMLHIVRYMGNPWYEKSSADGRNQQINTHEDLQERRHRNYLHRILTIAHKLDLPRCYGQDQFEASMAACRVLSDETLDTKHDRARSDYQRLIQYTIELTKAHGNMLQFDVAADGTYIDASSSYKPPFDEVSTSLKRLYEISETVPLSIVSFTPKEDNKRMRFGC